MGYSQFYSFSHRFDENNVSERCGNPSKTSREEDIPVTTVIFPSRSENHPFSVMFGRNRESPLVYRPVSVINLRLFPDIPAVSLSQPSVKPPM